MELGVELELDNNTWGHQVRNPLLATPYIITLYYHPGLAKEFGFYYRRLLPKPNIPAASNYVRLYCHLPFLIPIS